MAHRPSPARTRRCYNPRLPDLHALATPATAALRPEAALALFDRLAPVPLEALPGAWRGEGFPTGHPLDGALEAYGWHGKRFDAAEHAHPLVFHRWGSGLLCIRPSLAALALPLVEHAAWLKSPAPARLVRTLLPLLATQRPQARLRMTQHRGVVTAALVYDRVPIRDLFRQADADTLLGLMERPGERQPFFFVLRREALSASIAPMHIRTDDLTGPQIRALLEEHLRHMHEISPPESVHALDLSALRRPEITFWTAWDGAQLLGCGALKQLDAAHGEVKSMRTASGQRRRGVARAMLAHIVAEARRRRLQRLSLETGSQPAFVPARTLYASFGFRECGPFAGYRPDPNSVFMTCSLD